MFGRDRDRPGVLIELSSDLVIDGNGGEQVPVMRNKIWYGLLSGARRFRSNLCSRSTIQKANALAPAYSKVYKEMILFCSPDRPLLYGSKGAVLRKQAIATYQEDIDALYVTHPLPSPFSGA